MSCCAPGRYHKRPTHHGTSPNSGMYLRGKFSRGTPKIFAPPMNSLSFFFSKLLTVIPWRTWRWNRITLLSVTFMIQISLRDLSKQFNHDLCQSLGKTTGDWKGLASLCSSISPVAQVTRKWGLKCCVQGSRGRW